MTGKAAADDVLLAEYAQLKAEQQSRIGTRDNLLYAAFTAAAAVIAGALSAGYWAVILAAPPAMLVLGWTYLSNDRKVTEIGRYVRLELAPRLGNGAFAWEQDTEEPRARRTRKAWQLAADLTAFPGAAAALAVTAAVLSGATPLLVVAVAEVAASILLGRMFARYSGMVRGS